MSVKRVGTPGDPVLIATGRGAARLYYDRAASGSGNPGWVLAYRAPDGQDATEPLAETRRHAHRRAEIEACCFLTEKGLR